jgi:microcompartment protein CcmK/EutM
MTLGKVVGTVVASHKAQGLEGFTLQIVQTLDLTSMTETNTFVVAVDGVGAGEGELVLCCSGSSARMTESTQERPVDAVIVAIVDSTEMNGRTVYDKSND